MHSTRIPLARMYDYRRKLPHYQKDNRAVFVTFRKGNREPFSPQARDVVLQCCLKGNGNRFALHAAVIMPEHATKTAGPMACLTF